ncbi:MAG: HD family hydrolase [Pseudomonadota bacterium]
MLSGRRLDLLDPSPLDIEIEDIAHGLARVARWNGQTRGDWAYSVAQHSLLVTDLCADLRRDLPDTWLLAALLHDAPEYVVGDLITPFKAAVGGGYKALERRLQAAVHLRFGLPAQLPDSLAKLIKRADRAAAYLEATQLAGFAQPEARKLFRPPPDLAEHALAPWSPPEAKTRFLERFATLSTTSH